MLKDEYILYGNTNFMNLKCFICNDITHFIEKCPFTHYLPNKQDIIKAFRVNEENKRDKNFIRNKKREKNSLFINSYLKNNCNIYNIPSEIDLGFSTSKHRTILSKFSETNRQKTNSILLRNSIIRNLTHENSFCDPGSSHRDRITKRNYTDHIKENHYENYEKFKGFNINSEKICEFDKYYVHNNFSNIQNAMKKFRKGKVLLQIERHSIQKRHFMGNRYKNSFFEMRKSAGKLSSIHIYLKNFIGKYLKKNED